MKTQIKTILIVFSEELGEVEGAFDEDGNLLHAWSCNDASWRNEYFSPLLSKLGITVLDQWGGLSQDQKKKLKDWFHE